MGILKETQVGKSIKFFALSTTASKGVASNGNAYIDMMLTDGDMSLVGKCWDYSDDTGLPGDGDVLWIEGQMAEWPKGTKLVKVL
jgi:23S rRNA maturation-related 3'-5' exoribonuclease YhaM